MKSLIQCLLFLCGATVVLADSAQKPNIIFILTDDMGYGDLSSFGGKFVHTTNIDRLATEGIKFTQFYSPAPVCSPSRTGFMTGTYPGRWKIANYLNTRVANRESEQADFLDPKAPTIAHALKRAGYVTGHFGKWHMGGGRDVTNAPGFAAYGFDEHASTYESPEPDPNVTGTNWVWSEKDKVKRWDRSAYFVDKTLDFLKRHTGQPCFVDLWPDDVHTPWLPRGSDLSKNRPKGDESPAHFKGVLAEYDRQIGRLLDGLKELGLETNTVVVFTSDNGPMPPFAQRRTAGFRGSKDSLYEGGTAEPFIVRWPGHFPAGKIDATTVVHGMDLFKIFCHLAGTPAPTDEGLTGEDLTEAFYGKPMVRKTALFWEYGRTRSYFIPKAPNGSPNLAMRDGQWKLLVNDNGTGAQLFDIIADRNETSDLIQKYPEISQRMTATLLQWRKSLP